MFSCPEVKEQFLESASRGQAVHIGVHLEQEYQKLYSHFTGIERTYEQANNVGLALRDKITSLWTVIQSDLVPQSGPKDIVATSSFRSAIVNPQHNKYLTSNNVNVALITGRTSSCCVRHTLNNCIALGIKPIMVMDAIDFLITKPITSPKDFAHYTEKAQQQWNTENPALTSVHDVKEWANELYLP